MSKMCYVIHHECVMSMQRESMHREVRNLYREDVYDKDIV